MGGPTLRSAVTAWTIFSSLAPAFTAGHSTRELMPNLSEAAAQEQVYLYLPYADDQGAGMQRFGSEMIRALLRTGLNARILIGEVSGAPAWLDELPHEVILGASLRRRLPASLAALTRLLWIQFLLPLKAGRGATLLTLADRDLATIPLMRQIAVAHDLTQVTQLRQLSGIAHDVRNRLWRRGLARSDKVIAISGTTKQDLVEHFGLPADSITVIYEGYDATIFRPPSDVSWEPKPPYLLYAGTLAPNKNIPFLLDVYARLRERADVRLTLVGKQDDAQVGALLSALPVGIREGVEFAGFVSDGELATLMQECAAFVFPSLYEGFGLAPVEAMACGAPVISSYAGSLREVVSTGGVLLSPTDKEAWVSELTHVLEDADYREQLSERALTRSRAFSWDRAAQAYRALLDQQA